MKHQTFSFNSRNQKFFAQSWSPETTPKAVLCHLHGHGDYSDRYAHVAAFMAERGIAMMSYDQYGHGRTEGVKGHFPSYEAVMDGMDAFLKQADEHFMGAPKFWYGHSTGGNFCLNHVLKRKPEVKGVIATSPWIKLALTPPKSQVYLAKLMVNIYPSFTQRTKLDAGAISRDPKEVKKYQDDPLVHDMMSPTFFLDSFQAGEWALEHANEWDYPLLLMHGSGDQLTDHDATKAFAEKAAGKDVTFKSWEGLFHEMHNEEEREEVMGMMAEWVLKRVSSLQ